MSIDYKDFWKDATEGQRNYNICNSIKSSDIDMVRQNLGFKLPDSYIELMKIQNGGYPRKTCHPTTEATSWAEDHIAVKFLLGVGDSVPYSLLGDMGSKFWIEEWGYPNIGIYFGYCPSGGHDFLCLDYRDCGPDGEPKVVHIDQEDDYSVVVLADNFDSFIKGLVDESEFY